MKRLLVAIGIVALILAAGGYSAFRIFSFKEEALTLLEKMSRQTESGHLAMAAETARDFQELWFQVENSLIQFTRREPLEHISSYAAMLPVLGQHNEAAGFAALTEDMKYAVQELWENEIPFFRNLF